MLCLLQVSCPEGVLMRKGAHIAGDGESLHSSTSKASEYVFADNVAWSSEEEIEAAIVQASIMLPACSRVVCYMREHIPPHTCVQICLLFYRVVDCSLTLWVLWQGFLRQDYRTNLCQTVADGTPCHLANRCQHAHSYSELRLNAAIALEKIPPDFKTSLCDDFLITGIFQVFLPCDEICALHMKTSFGRVKIASRVLCVGTGNCPEGIACPRAHSLEELRTLAAIQLKALPPNFKTERCSAYDTSRTCPRGESLTQTISCEDQSAYPPMW